MVLMNLLRVTPRGLGGDFGVELFLVDDEAFVASPGDQIHAVVGADGERELPAFHCDQLDGCGEFEAGRCRGFMAHIDVGSKGLFLGPVEMGNHGFDTGPFEKSDQEAGGEDFGHDEKFLRFRIERWNGLGWWQDEFMLVTDAGFQCLFQFGTPDLPGIVSPRYESNFTAVVLAPQIRTATRSFGAGW